MSADHASTLDAARFWTKAFLVAHLPEAVKRGERFEPWVSPAMHIVSGALQFVACAGLFIAGMIRFVARFNEGPGLIYLNHQPSLTYGDFMAMGALAYVSFLLTPQGALLAYGVGEGIVRIFEPALGAGLPGLGFCWAVRRLAAGVRRRGKQARLAALIGPSRPDEVVLPDASRHRMLEVYSVEDKPWSDVQVIEHEGRFYMLTGRRLVPRGAHHAWRYLLHPVEEREVIRGAILRYPAVPSAAAQAPRHGAAEQTQTVGPRQAP